MPLVEIEKPEIITVSYHQRKGDPDYGSCLWARFNFDTKRYHLSIESDCGSFSYGWYPTPDTETFLQLCARFEAGYLLDKIASRTVVDVDATYKAVLEFLEDYDEYAYECLTKAELSALKDACGSNSGNDFAVMRAILDVLDDDTGFSGSCSEYDIACRIEMDYPRYAKKITQIYQEHIKPVVQKMVMEEGK